MVNIKLEVQQVDQILGALAKRPFEEVADLIANVRNQAIAQLNSAQESPVGEAQSTGPSAA